MSDFGTELARLMAAHRLGVRELARMVPCNPCLLVGGPGELGVELQGRGALRVAIAPARFYSFTDAEANTREQINLAGGPGQGVCL